MKRKLYICINVTTYMNQNTTFQLTHLTRCDTRNEYHELATPTISTHTSRECDSCCIGMPQHAIMISTHASHKMRLGIELNALCIKIFQLTLLTRCDCLRPKCWAKDTISTHASYKMRLFGITVKTTVYYFNSRFLQDATSVGVLLPLSHSISTHASYKMRQQIFIKIISFKEETFNFNIIFRKIAL